MDLQDLIDYRISVSKPNHASDLVHVLSMHQPKSYTISYYSVIGRGYGIEYKMKK